MSNEKIWIALPIVVVLAVKVYDYLCNENKIMAIKHQQRKREIETKKYRYRFTSGTRKIINRIYSIKDKLAFPTGTKTSPKNKTFDIYQMFYFLDDLSSFENYIERLNRKDPNLIKRSFYSDENIKHSLLTVALLRDDSREKRMKQFRLLLSYGLKIKNGDQLVNNFLLYHNIPDYVKENIILFSLSDLIDDVKIRITNNLILLHLEEY